jgi:hypothetical protein
MTDRSKLICASFLGALCLYCSHRMTGDSGDGAVPDASAGAGDTCEACPVQAPEVIFEGVPTFADDAGSLCSAPAFDITAYRTIIVHRASGSNSSVAFRHGQGTGADWVRPPQVESESITVFDARLGTSLRLQRFVTDCAEPTAGITIVGYRDR